ncbi:MAG TPA: glycosyltransferase family 39 protein [Candidatus Acidoferrum sp.]|nr:glycosyltransferase family 39 protein [Candidatus Acidoferrum sp.]
MNKRAAEFWKTDLAVLVFLALASVAIHTATNGQYGFHRDELQTLDDARHMDWGFVAYPPITPLIGRIELMLFGTSLVGFRFFAAVAVSAAMVLAGLIAKKLGGGRREQVLAAVATCVAPVALAQGAVFQYVSFDYLWGVLATYFLVKLCKSGDARWWVAIGFALGLGMETRYTAGFWTLGIVGGVLLSDARKYLASKWLWAGVGIAVLLFLPNVIWQAKHDFISLDFLKHLHERDVRQGRDKGFLLGQILLCVNVVTAPLAAMGLWFLSAKEQGRRYAVVGWMVLATFLLFWVAKARFYYTAPIYPVLLAAGSVAFGNWRKTAKRGMALTVDGVQWALILLNGALLAVFVMPIAPFGGAAWRVTSKLHDQFREQIGWQDLTEHVAQIFSSLPAEERARTGILAGNYGEGGALNLYGPAMGLPHAMAGTNSFWYRGYDSHEPQTVIVVGLEKEEAEANFTSCAVAAKNTNRFGVENEESRDHPDIYLCRGLKGSWADFWKKFRRYG